MEIRGTFIVISKIEAIKIREEKINSEICKVAYIYTQGHTFHFNELTNEELEYVNGIIDFMKRKKVLL